MSKKNVELVELDEMGIIIRIPKNCKKFKIKATVDIEGVDTKVTRKFSFEDIMTARQDFLDNVEFGDDFDAKFQVTEEGLRWLEEQLKNKEQE